MFAEAAGIGFLPKRIEPGAGKAPRLESGDRRRFVDELAASRIQENGPAFHLLDLLGAQDAIGSACVQGDDIRRLKTFAQGQLVFLPVQIPFQERVIDKNLRPKCTE